MIAKKTLEKMYLLNSSWNKFINVSFYLRRKDGKFGKQKVVGKVINIQVYANSNDPYHYGTISNGIYYFDLYCSKIKKNRRIFGDWVNWQTLKVEE